MAKFSLLPNESIILKTERVKHGGMFAIYTDDLILTSQNLVVVCKGTFGNTKDVVRYPLNQIKMNNGEPQALLGTAQNGTPQLEVYFLNGQQEAFGFQSMGKKEITQWINAICKAVTGHESSTMSTTSAFAIPGTKYLAETLKGTVDTFKDTFGIKSKQQGAEPSAKRVSKKCISCSAPLIGVKGQTVQCKYCDTKQVL